MCIFSLFPFIRGIRLFPLGDSPTVYTPHPGPSGYGHDAMGYMMDSQAHMMHRPPGDPGFHQGYPHYPPAEYYGQHL